MCLVKVRGWLSHGAQCLGPPKQRRKDEKTVDGPEAPGANFDLVPRCLLVLVVG